MLDALKMSLDPQAVVAFAVYLLGAALIFALFALIYTRVTPHKEFRLIREGNPAAAIALSGALIGFAVPLSSVIEHSSYLLDFVVWALIAALVQLLTFFVISITVKGLHQRIQNGEIAAAVFMASTAVSMGLINAACMTPA
jgi:putative membrane protein